MATKAATRRLTKEYAAFQKNPPPYLLAKPLENNILEWWGELELNRFMYDGIEKIVDESARKVIYGPCWDDCVIVFPSEYPFKPPSIRMTTPSGRFLPEARLCLSMSDFHPSSWNPGWSVATILNGLLSFMCSDEATTGSIKTTDADKIIYASRSHQHNLNNKMFKEVFPELCIPEAISVEVLYPLHPSSSSSSAKSPPSSKTTKQALTQHQLHNRQNIRQLQPSDASRNGNIGVNRNVNGQNIRNVQVVGNNNRNNPMQRRLADQWHRWLMVFLVFLYLVVVKLLSRSSEVMDAESLSGAGRM
ncbi:6996_t:CDS:2 [Paraglomus occultum]|uniref:6996_t:CDS:1 n=1 Tax=Paraglomus occultum TaxID=144539 RepID=A0A9N9BRU4_9GLOM|nr:6996_t:CDS:2 [Paraglomus occultum]